MAWDLGEIVMSSRVDLSGAKGDIAEFDRFVKQHSINLSGYLNNIVAVAGKINRLSLEPKVNESGLHHLNKVYDQKIAHHNLVAKTVRSNVITPAVDASEIDAAIGSLQQLIKFQQAAGLSARINAAYVIEHTINSSRFIRDFERAGESVAEKISKKLEKTTIKTEARGGFFGVAIDQLVREFSKGFSDGSGVKRVGTVIGENAPQELERRLAKFTQGAVYKGGFGAGVQNAFPEFTEWPKRMEKVGKLLNNEINQQFKAFQDNKITTKEFSADVRKIYAEILRDLYQRSKAQGLSPSEAAIAARKTLKSPVGGQVALSNHIAQTLADNNWEDIRDGVSHLATGLRKATNFIRLANAYQIDEEAKELAKQYKKLIPAPTADRKILTIFAAPASDKGRAGEEFGGGIQSLFPKSNFFSPTLEAYNFTGHPGARDLTTEEKARIEKIKKAEAKLTKSVATLEAKIKQGTQPAEPIKQRIEIAKQQLETIDQTLAAYTSKLKPTAKDKSDIAKLEKQKEEIRKLVGDLTNEVLTINETVKPTRELLTRTSNRLKAFGAEREGLIEGAKKEGLNFFETMAAGLAGKVGGRIVAGETAQSAGGGSAISDPVSGLLFGYSRSARDILAARKAAISMGYEPENVQVLGHSMGSFTARQAVGTADLLKQNFKGVGVAIGDYFKELLPESKNYRSIYNVRDPLNIPLTLGMFPQSATQYTTKQFPGRGLDPHSYFQSMLTPEFRTLTNEIGFKGFAGADQFNPEMGKLSAALGRFSEMIMPLRGVFVAENIAKERPPEYNVAVPPVLKEGKDTYTDLRDLEGLIKGFKHLDQELQQYLPHNIEKTAQKQGSVITTDSFGGAYQDQYNMINQKLSEFAQYLGGQGKATLTETIAEIERLKKSAKAMAIAIDPSKFVNDHNIPNYLPKPSPIQIGQPVEKAPEKAPEEKTVEEIRFPLVLKLKETVEEVVEAERGFARAARKLENTMTLGFADKYRKFLGNQTKQTAGLMGQASGVLYDKGINAAKDFAVNRVLPGAVGAVRTGYNLLQAGENFALGATGTKWIKNLVQSSALPLLAGSAAAYAAPSALGTFLHAGQGLGSLGAAGIGALAQPALQHAPWAVRGLMSGLGWMGSQAAPYAGAGLLSLYAGNRINAVGKGLIGGVGNAVQSMLPGSASAGNQFPMLSAGVPQPIKPKNETEALALKRKETAEIGSYITNVMPEATISRLKVAMYLIERINEKLSKSTTAGGSYPTEFEEQFKATFSAKSGQLGKTRSEAFKTLIDFAPTIKQSARAGNETAIGFLDGLEMWFPRVRQTGNQTAQDYLDALRKTLDSHSPSRKTIQEGSNAGEGFYLGVNKWLASIGKSGQQAGNAYLKGLSANPSLSNSSVFPALKNDFRLPPPQITGEQLTRRLEQIKGKAPNPSQEIEQTVSKLQQLKQQYQDTYNERLKLAAEQRQQPLIETISSPARKDPAEISRTALEWQRKLFGQPQSKSSEDAFKRLESLGGFVSQGPNTIKTPFPAKGISLPDSSFVAPHTITNTNQLIQRLQKLKSPQVDAQEQLAQRLEAAKPSSEVDQAIAKLQQLQKQYQDTYNERFKLAAAQHEKPLIEIISSPARKNELPSNNVLGTPLKSPFLARGQVLPDNSVLDPQTITNTNQVVQRLEKLKSYAIDAQTQLSQRLKAVKPSTEIDQTISRLQALKQEYTNVYDERIKLAAAQNEKPLIEMVGSPARKDSAFVPPVSPPSAVTTPEQLFKRLEELKATAVNAQAQITKTLEAAQKAGKAERQATDIEQIVSRLQALKQEYTEVYNERIKLAAAQHEKPLIEVVKPASQWQPLQAPYIPQLGVRADAAGKAPKIPAQNLNANKALQGQILAQQMSAKPVQASIEKLLPKTANEQGREWGESLAHNVIDGFKQLNSFSPQIQRVYQAIAREIKRGNEIADGGIRGFYNTIKTQFEPAIQRLEDAGIPVRKFASVVKELGVAGLALLGVFTFGDAISQFAQQSAQAALQMDTLKRSLDISTAGKSTQYIRTLRAESDRLGISLQSSIQGLKGIAGATFNTPLEGRPTLDIQRGFSAAIASQGLTREDSEGVFLAVQQMASKSTISMEELRLQLAERLPNALNAAASAMGKTTPQFIKMVSTGDILANELLPRMARQLEAESGLTGSANHAQASINRLQNALFSLQASAGAGILVALQGPMEVTAAGLTLLAENGTLLTGIFASLALFGVFKLISMIKSLIPVFGPLSRAILGQITMQQGLKMAMFDVQMMARGSIAVLSAFARIAVPIAFITGITMLAQKIGELSSGTEEVKKFSDTLAELDKRFEQLKSVKDFSNPLAPLLDSQKSEQIIAQRGGQNFFQKNVLEMLGMNKNVANASLKDLLFNQNLIKEAVSADDLDKNLAQSAERLNVAQQAIDRLSKAGDLNRIKQLNKEISDLTYTLSAAQVSGADQTQINAIQDKLKSAQGQLNSSAGNALNSKATIDQSVSVYQKMVDILKTAEPSDPTYRLAQKYLPAVQSELEKWKTKQREINGLISNNAKEYDKVTLAIDRASIRANATAEANKQYILGQQTEAINSAGLGGNANRQLGIENARRAQEEAQLELQRLKQQMADLINPTNQISATDRSQIEKLLQPYGKTFDTVSQETLDKLKQTVASSQIKGSIDKILSARSEAKRLETDIKQAEANVANSHRELRQAQLDASQAVIDFNYATAQQARDLQKSVDDQRRAVEDAIDEIRNEMKRSAGQLRQLQYLNSMRSKISGITSEGATSISNSIVDWVGKLFDISNDAIQKQIDAQQVDKKIRDLFLGRDSFEQQITSTVYNYNKSLASESGSLAEAPTGGFAKVPSISAFGPVLIPHRQNYGVDRDGGSRKHAGQDFDLNPNDKVIAGIGGVVTKSARQPGGYFNYIDVFNKALGVVERIAEATNFFVKVGDRIKPGQVIGQGTHETGVIHREIRKDVNASGQGGYGFEGTVDYIKYMKSLQGKGVPVPGNRPTASAGVSSSSGQVKMTDTGKVNAQGQKLFKIDVLDASGNAVYSTIGYSGLPGHQGLTTVANGVAGSNQPIPEGRYKIGAYETGNFGDVGDRWIGVQGRASDPRQEFGFHADVDGILGSRGCIVFRDPATVQALANAVQRAGAKDLVVDYGLGTVSAKRQNVKPLSSQTVSTVKNLGTMHASWYGPGFDGRQAADGSIFNQNAMTVAHKTLPFGTMLRIVGSGGEAIAKVTDRGPFIPGRDIDLSKGVAEKVGILGSGVGPVKVEVVNLVKGAASSRAAGSAGSVASGFAPQLLSGSVDLSSIPYEQQADFLRQQSILQGQVADAQIQQKRIAWRKEFQDQMFSLYQQRQQLDDFTRDASRSTTDLVNQLFAKGPIGDVIDQAEQVNRSINDKILEQKRKTEEFGRSIRTFNDTITNLKNTAAQLPDSATAEDRAKIDKVIADLGKNVQKYATAKKVAEDAIAKLQESSGEQLKKFERELRGASAQNLQSINDFKSQIDSLNNRFAENTPERQYISTIQDLSLQFAQARLNAEDLLEKLNSDILKTSGGLAKAEATGDMSKSLALSYYLNQLKEQKTLVEQNTSKFNELAEAKAKADERSRFFREQENRLLSAQADLLDSLGYKYQANALRRADAFAQQKAEYDTEKSYLQQLADSGRMSAQDVALLLANLEQLNEIKLEQIRGQFQTLNDDIKATVKDGLGGAFNDFFTKLRDTGDFLKSLEEAAMGFFDKISSKIFDIASNYFTNQIFGSLGLNKADKGKEVAPTDLLSSLLGNGGDKGENAIQPTGGLLGGLLGGKSDICQCFGMGAGIGGNSPFSLTNLGFDPADMGQTTDGFFALNQGLGDLTTTLGSSGNGVIGAFDSLFGSLTGGGGGLGGLLSGLLGGGSGGGFMSLFGGGGGGSGGGDILGSLFSIFGSGFLGFSQGGVIQNFAKGSLAGAISKAMNKERVESGGLTPKLVVVNEHEAVLNPRATRSLGHETINRLNSGFKIENLARGSKYNIEQVGRNLSQPKPQESHQSKSSTDRLQVEFIETADGSKFVTVEQFEKGIQTAEERGAYRGAAMVGERSRNSASARAAFGFK